MKCNKCGKEKELKEFTKRSERKCGYRSICKKCEVNRKKDKQKTYYKTKSGRLASYKYNAKYRNLDFNLTKEEFESFWQNLCYYCGSEIETIGLDRVNNSKGYEINNVVSCCKTCNKMKLALTQQEFYDKIIDIYKRRKL